MVFKSDKQRKAMFANMNRGNPRSNTSPQMIVMGKNKFKPFVASGIKFDKNKFDLLKKKTREANKKKSQIVILDINTFLFRKTANKILKEKRKLN